MIESGVINYGEVFREKMAKGDWDVKSVDMEKVNQSDPLKTTR